MPDLISILQRMSLRGGLAAMALLCAVTMPWAQETAWEPVIVRTAEVSPAYACGWNDEKWTAFAPEDPQLSAGVEWRKDVPLQRGERLDLEQVLGKKENSAVYVRVRLTAQRPGRLSLRMGSDDGLTLIVNGSRVMRSRTNFRDLLPNQDEAQVELPAGESTLLFRVYQAHWWYGLQFTITAEAAMKVRQSGTFPPDKARVAVTIPEEGMTSAGIYDEKNRLVSTLWSLRRMPAGTFTFPWNGNNDFEEPAGAGNYHCRVVVNQSTYKHLGMVGNTGMPSTTFGRIPVNFECVAADSEGYLYTTHDWEEAGFDVIRWSPETGHVAGTSGHTAGGMGKAIAVDNDYVYVSVWGGGNPNDLKAREKGLKFAVSKIKIDKQQTAQSPREWKRVSFTRAGKEIVVYNGGVAYPPEASAADRPAMAIPLLALAVHDNRLYVTDSLGGKVRIYDKETGEPAGELAVRLPMAVAVDAAGNVWVGHEHAKVSVFGKTGDLLGTPITDLTDISHLACGADGTLAIADRGAARVILYQTSGATARQKQIIGAPARPGDRAADRFFLLHGITLDPAGNVIIVQNEKAMRGGRMAKFSPQGKLLWEQMGLEFSSGLTYAKDYPDIAFSQYCHTYRLDRRDGSWGYLGNNLGKNNAYWAFGGAGKILKLNGNYFYYGNHGDGMQVYRISGLGAKESSPVLDLVAVLGRSSPLPDGRFTEAWKRENMFLWSWGDARGEHVIHPEDVRYAQRPEDKKPLWQYSSLTVDAAGNVWLASADRGGVTPEQGSVWMIPMQGLNSAGNPIYDWKDARCVIAKELLRPAGMPKQSFHPSLVVQAEDNLTYLYGNTSWKKAPTNGGMWMGGNLLSCFRGAECLWRTVLPTKAVGMCDIPGGQGGCIIGGSPMNGQIDHYSSDGLLIGTMRPDPRMVVGAGGDNPSGCLDTFAAVTVCRDPRDRILDVFVEDNFNLRVMWYRIDDSAIRRIDGTVTMTPTPAGQ